MKKILALGIGSRIMTDDAIGVYLIEDFSKRAAYPNVTYIAGETDVDYCIEEISKYDYVIIIDAFLSGKQPGKITLLSLDELKNENEDCFYSMHGMHLLNVLRKAGRPAYGIFIGIEPYKIDFGFTLSSLLQSCYYRLLEEVGQHICKYIENLGGEKMQVL